MDWRWESNFHIRFSRLNKFFTTLAIIICWLFLISTLDVDKTQIPLKYPYIERLLIIPQVIFYLTKWFENNHTTKGTLGKKLLKGQEIKNILCGVGMRYK